MLTLAGVCFFGIVSQGPLLFPGSDLSSLTVERREFIEEQFSNDIRTAIEFYGHVAMNLQDEGYDMYFEDEVAGGIEYRDDGPPGVFAARGFKDAVK